MSDREDRLSKEEHARILQDRVIPGSGLDAVTSQDKPTAIILAGQPGAGKASLVRAAEVELRHDVVAVDPDDLRRFHPQAKRFQEQSPYDWSQKTNSDAGQWARELRDVAIEGRKNVIVDTTLGNAKPALQTIREFQSAGYDVEIRAVATHRLESELGVDQRFSEKLEAEGYGRHVPEGVRSAIYNGLPTSLDTIHAQTDVPIRIFNREGAELYDSRTDARPPGQALEEAREARVKDPNITHDLRDGWREQQAWHRDLPETLANNPKVDPPTRENLLAERSANHVAESVERTTREAVDVDHVARIRPARIHAGAALGIAGLALDAYDAADSVRAAHRLSGEGNATAAESELIHFGSRTVGGFAGAGLGATVGAAAGVETGPGLFVTGAIGGVAGVFAGDKIAEWTDNRRIYNQDDRQGNTWTHDPENPALGWQRKTPIDASNDNIDNPMRGTLRASPALANELNYKSSSTSVELVLGGPPAQRDPFTQPANASDAPSFSPASWNRDSDSGEWRREVVLAFAERGLSPKRTDVAEPERAAELDRAAAQTVVQNAANSPAAIAARYEDTYLRNGWAAHGEMPQAVRSARTDVDTLVASDDNRYQRRADGEWISTGLIYNSAATGNLREELNATREVLQATLPPPQAVQTPAPMTDDARLRDTVAGAYANAGVTPSPERIEAAAVAVRATMAANGIDPDTTALALRPGANGRYDQDSPIASMRLEADGKTYAIAAVTTTEDIQRAQAARPTTPPAADRPVEPARDGTPSPSREGAALRLNDAGHPNHAMFATLLDTVHARDRGLDRAPDDVSLQLAGGLTAQARARGLDAIGYAAFTPDGTKVAMTNTTDPSAPWARTAVGQVGELVGQSLAQSSEQVATLNRQQSLMQPAQDLGMQQQQEAVGRSLRMA
ncbi:MAG: zeta toxin family protein [Lysobacteraceae bacterium]